MAVGRILGDGDDAQPVLLAALPVAVCDCGAGGSAHLGAARHRSEQSDGARHQDQIGQRADVSLCGC